MSLLAKNKISDSRRLPLLVATLAMALLPALAGASSDMETAQGIDAWPVFRGPVAGGPDPVGVLPDGTFGLVEEWKIPLGSGYSNVSVADGKAVTMFTAGDVDVLAAFDVEDGSEVWRYELGEKYAGHTGSDDGPLGTPTLLDGGVYALGPKGQLVALSLDDGSERWRRTLGKENSTVPFYGYTSSPVVTGELVIVATGGEGHGITAFDRADGEVRWMTGDDSVTYQTPLVAELGGRTQLLAVTDQHLQGVDPESGQILWSLQHTEGEESEDTAHPTPVDDETFLVKYVHSSKLYRLTDGGVEEVWETRAFANTLALPVYHDGHFYGFTGRFLTCADAETGEIVWRSRPPGGQGVSLVDGHLAVVNPDGDLVLAEASPAGYEEVARIATLERGDYPIPSFASGRFFVRNLSEMATIRIDRDAAPKIAETEEEDRLHGAFGEWVAKVEAMPEEERQTAADAYFAEVETTPIHGEDGLVHFVYRGDAEDVGVSGFQPGNQEDGLFRLEGTDLFFRSYELDPKAQYIYAFTVDYGPPSPDPSNPRTVDMGFRSFSDLLMPEAPSAAHLEEPADDAPRGELDGFPFRSEILDNTREIQVWRPAGYGASDDRYPVLVVNHGDNVLRGGLMQNTLDNLVGKTVEPLIAVFVPRVQGPEYGGAQADDFNRFLAEELLPHLDRHYRTDPARRAVAGPASAGVAALYAAFSMPETFPMAAAQSYYEIEPGDEKLKEMIRGEGAELEKVPQKIVVAWSHNDYDIPDGPNAEEATKEILEALDGSAVEVRVIEAHYSPNWGGWRLQDDDVLEALFPAPPGDGEG